MSPLELVAANVLTPIVLAFALGVLATLIKSDLRFPEELYTALAIYLLLAIGLKGGAALAKTPITLVWAPALATIIFGILTPLWTYALARYVGRFAVPDAAALAAHYGSVSAVTFIASLSFLDALNVPYPMFMPALVAILEVPAIVIALLIAKVAMGGKTAWGEVFHEILSGRSILLLLGGLLIGYFAQPRAMDEVAPFFVAPFKGILALFLLEMGMVAARRLGDLKKAGLFLVALGIALPLVHGALGVYVGHLVFPTDLAVGGSMILGVLVASASYIAAPAAVRIALPQANPSLYLTASLGITFPFNLTVGIPLYYYLARALA